MARVGRAFVGRVEIERDRDEAADLLEVARTGGAQERFQFGERQFDRIEVRTVRREESHEGAHVLDRGPHRRLLVDREVVEDDDIPQAGAQRSPCGSPSDYTGVIAESGAARAAAVAPEQIGRHAAFIEPDILPGIVERLMVGASGGRTSRLPA